MSLPVCPSAFIRFAVAMCSVSSTLRGRPNLVPLARDDALGRAVRSPDISRARQAGVTSKIQDHHWPDPNIIRTAGVKDSDFPVSQTSPRYPVSDSGQIVGPRRFHMSMTTAAYLYLLTND